MTTIGTPPRFTVARPADSRRRRPAVPLFSSTVVGAAAVALLLDAGRQTFRADVTADVTADVVGLSAVVPGQQPTPPPPSPVDPPGPLIPTPAPTSTPAPEPGPESDHVPFTVPQPDTEEPEFGWLGEAVSGALEWFFRELVFSALNQMLDAVGDSLLATPTPQELPHLTEVWTATQLIAVAAFPLLMLFAGLILMGYESIQSRYSLRELLPRVVIGFLAANLSWTFAQHATVLANALARAVLGDGVNPVTATEAIMQLFRDDPDDGLGDQGLGGLWLVFIGLAIAVMLAVLLLTYVVRIAVFAILVAAAPLALSCHALPQLEPVAFWWWRAFTAVLAIQVAQSLTLVVALKVFFTPGQGYTWIGEGSSDGWMNLFLAIALLYVLIKSPGWLLSTVRIRSRRSVVSSIVRAVVAYKTLGAFGRRVGAGRASRRGGGKSPPRGGRPPGGPGGGAPPGRPRRGPSGGPSSGPRPVGPRGGGPRGGGPRGGPRAGGGARRAEPNSRDAAMPSRLRPGAGHGDPAGPFPRRQPQPPQRPQPPQPPGPAQPDRPAKPRPAPVAATSTPTAGSVSGRQPATAGEPPPPRRRPASPAPTPGRPPAVLPAAAPAPGSSPARSSLAASSAPPAHPKPQTGPRHAPAGRLLARSPQSAPAPSAPARPVYSPARSRSSGSRPSPARPTSARIPSRPPLRPAPTREIH